MVGGNKGVGWITRMDDVSARIYISRWYYLGNSVEAERLCPTR